MSGAATKQLTCVQCPLGCALEVCLDEAGAVVHVSGRAAGAARNSLARRRCPRFEC